MQAKKKRTTAETPGKTAPPACDAVAVRVVPSGEEIELPVRPLSIGSDPANDIVLDDAYVSRFHCELDRQGAARIVVRDLGSRNGTFVAGNLVREREVEAGDLVRVGDHALVVLGPPRPRAGPLEQLAGTAPALRLALSQVLRAARAQATLLIGGESGSGKELLARLAHAVSSRAAGPFVAVDCGAIPRELVESELFGHERGAFTGAAERRAGVFLQAQGGTLFLDEIGELPGEQQARLLRALETRRVRRVGGTAEEAIDVRVVAATHRDLREAAAQGTFRLDLFHRLCGIEVRLPPLRERLEDLPLLVERFAAEIHGTRPAAEVVSRLRRYHWPGNIRELRNAVHRAAVLGDGSLRLEDLLPRQSKLTTAPAHPGRVGRAAAAPEDLDSVIMRAMEQALARAGSVRGAASLLGMPHSTFHDRARRLGLRMPRNVRRAR